MVRANKTSQRRLMGPKRVEVEVSGHTAGQDGNDQQSQQEQRQEPREALHDRAGVALRDQS